MDTTENISETNPQQTETLHVPTMAEMMAEGKVPELLFWVGCAGSFDERAQKITRSICKILQHVGISYAVLGAEESCTGDPAKRAGNEFLFQMQALANIEVLNAYEVKKIVTGCPHCFNTLKNEYPQLGGNYEVIHHTQLIQQLIDEGRLKVQGGESFKGKRITYHDACYLGRANDVYEAPRSALEILDAELVEMKRCRTNGLCCGAGGAQMFKDPEKGNKEINVERIGDAIEAKAEIVASACPFCMTMLRDGVKYFEKEQEMQVLDIAEITARANGL
ncbi:(Fe-S)-binding protein [Mucilaginibacter sp. KACC 22063]|uniref:(Fe-S)-binding protein n=1 Tax=Mucilaginibacter sp. KACC 22063 TaxID=3025666 RepID=UPI002365F672|nr:(Fe-S)-binding protein [Mucilaginibacter sp. KACC 22063]WDF56441.1 (Fe-S)-binding protein [Mucilaginibacter sp. KACC 22063]